MASICSIKTFIGLNQIHKLHQELRKRSKAVMQKPEPLKMETWIRLMIERTNLNRTIKACFKTKIVALQTYSRNKCLHRSNCRGLNRKELNFSAPEIRKWCLWPIIWIISLKLKHSNKSRDNNPSSVICSKHLTQEAAKSMTARVSQTWTSPEFSVSMKILNWFINLIKTEWAQAQT